MQFETYEEVKFVTQNKIF